MVGFFWRFFIFEYDPFFRFPITRHKKKHCILWYNGFRRLLTSVLWFWQRIFFISYKVLYSNNHRIHIVQNGFAKPILVLYWSLGWSWTDRSTALIELVPGLVIPSNIHDGNPTRGGIGAHSCCAEQPVICLLLFLVVCSVRARSPPSAPFGIWFRLFPLFIAQQRTQWTPQLEITIYWGTHWIWRCRYLHHHQSFQSYIVLTVVTARHPKRPSEWPDIRT